MSILQVDFGVLNNFPGTTIQFLVGNDMDAILEKYTTCYIFLGYTHKVTKCIQQGWNSRWPTANNNLGKLGDSPNDTSAFVGSFPCFKPRGERAGLSVLVLKNRVCAQLLSWENLHYPPMLEIWTSSLPCDGCKKKSIQAFSIFRAVFCWKQHMFLINGSF